VSSQKNFRLPTLAIHGGVSPDPATGAILTPIYQSTTYVQEAVGVHKGFTYSRAANPTVDALERALGALEDTPPAVCFATGMAAITTLFLSVLKAGDHAIISDVVYGGTVRLFQQLLGGLGIDYTFVDASKPELVEQAITSRTQIILIETPGNPTLKLVDVAAVAEVAHRHGIKLAVDNTFLTPVLQPIFELGADISVLSTTNISRGTTQPLAVRLQPEMRSYSNVSADSQDHWLYPVSAGGLAYSAGTQDAPLPHQAAFRKCHRRSPVA
jgi:cystathionine beta-lyase/cystathionine gamma-synthase